MTSYAVKIEDHVVTQLIVGNNEWAINNLGGFWVDSEIKIGIGWSWSQENGFRPPQPSTDCWWENDRWICPEPKVEK